MTSPAAAPGTAPPDPSRPQGATAAAPTPDAEHRVHMYEAASSRRDQVLSSFTEQRDAILKAVAEQRAAAVAPIAAVQAKRTAQANPAAPGTAVPAGTGIGVAGNRALTDIRGAVAADIVVALRTMVAAEVRAQIVALLQAADAKLPERTAAGPDPAAS